MSAVEMINDWYEKIRCPKCGKTGMATLSQNSGDAPVIERVPDGFKVVITKAGPDFHCRKK